MTNEPTNQTASSSTPIVAKGSEPFHRHGQVISEIPMTTPSSTSINIAAGGIASAIDIAHYILLLAQSEEEPDYVTHLRLQKLLYYVQGWSLAIRGRIAFPERIEAWAHGPVVVGLYHVLKQFGITPIDPAAIPTPNPLSKDDAQLVDSVWTEYRRFTAFALRRMTHSESPWLKARGSAGPADACSTEITCESMLDHFSSLLNQ